ncbi:MAG: acetylxylan esterase [Tannerella sp.]|jgi:cephalosporin-C deacetylase-like acetyl esterase|nr:acetylxylan esterase [Tannerella sp.]
MKKLNILIFVAIAICAIACSTSEDKSPAVSETFSNEWKYQAGAGDDKSWTLSDYDDSGWKVITTEKSFKDNGLTTEDGAGRYRKTITLSDDFYAAVKRKGGVILHLDSIAGMDSVYVNGHFAGGFSMFGAPRGNFFVRSYFVPASYFQKGNNLIAFKFATPWGDDAPFGRGLFANASLSFTTAETADKIALDYAVNDSDYIFMAPDPLQITAKIQNDNAWDVKGKLIIDITTDDYRPIKSDTIALKLKGKALTPKDYQWVAEGPGFYRFTIQFVRDNDINLEKKFNLGYEPEKISSPIDAHDDFKAFWDNNLKELAKVSPNYVMTLKPEMSNDEYEVYFVEMKSLNNEVIRGYYSKPKFEGKFPVIIEYMGYGSTAYAKTDKFDGFAWYVPSVRGQGLNRLDPDDDFWITIGLKDKEGYYYQGAFCDVVRAIDFVCSRPEIDADKIAVRGGSQGGALSFVAASLDKRVKVCAPNVPFLSDYRDYFRIVDWPRSDFDNYAKTHPDFDWEHVYDLLTYFDIKNLAQWIECPLTMAIGVQDPTCPPHINFAAYNQVKSEKYWVASPRAGHSIPNPEIWEAEHKFIRKKLGME